MDKKQKGGDVLLRDDFDAGPIHMNLIDTNLWLGNLTAATETANLETNKINSILTVDTCPLPRKITEMKGMHFMFINVTDSPTEDLISHFEASCEFITNSVENGVVLVHCYFGVSRSATLVIAYLMKRYSIGFKEALERAKSKRELVSPNPGFLAQLQLYDNMGCKVEPTHMQYRKFRLYITANQVKKVKIVPQGCSDVIKPDPALVRARPDPKCYRCRKCRRIVALESNTLPHLPNEKYSWKQNLDTGQVCEDTYFVEPMTWMAGVTATEQGRLLCPQCRCKLGSFSWTMGCQCPCGTRVSPAFYLIPSKVDKSNFLQNVQVTV